MFRDFQWPRPKPVRMYQASDYHLLEEAVKGLGPADGVLAACAAKLRANGIDWYASYLREPLLDKDILRVMGWDRPH